MDRRRHHVGFDRQFGVGGRNTDAGQEENRAVERAILAQRNRRGRVTGGIRSIDAHPADLPLNLHPVLGSASDSGSDRPELGPAIFRHRGGSGLFGDIDGGVRIGGNDSQFRKGEEAVARGKGALGFEPNDAAVHARRKVVSHASGRAPGVKAPENLAAVAIENDNLKVVIAHAAGIEQRLAFIGSDGTEPDFNPSDRAGLAEIDFPPGGVLGEAIQRHRTVVVKAVGIPVRSEPGNTFAVDLVGGLTGHPSDRPVEFVKVRGGAGESHRVHDVSCQIG